MNAVAAQVSTISDAWKFVQELWEAPQPRRTGTQSTSTWGDPYWDGTLYLLGLYETGGKFRAYGVGTTSGNPTLSVTTSVSPGTTVAPGSSVSVSGTFNVTSGTMTNGKLGYRLLDSQGNYVGQTTTEGVNLSSGQSQSVPWTFTAPTTTGAYSLYAGAWDANWAGYLWNNVATLTVSGTAATNLLTNGGFEANTGQSSTGWLEINATDASYAEANTGSHGGSNQLAFYRSTAFQSYTYQIVNVTNGNYTVRSWYRGGGTFNGAQMVIKQYNGTNSITKDLKTGLTGTYQKSEQTSIAVTSGKIEVGFWVDGAAGSWLTIDDVVLIKQ